MKRHIKHRHMPGDISRWAKIRLLEKGYLYEIGDVERSVVRAFKKRVLMKERAVLKRRFHTMLRNLDVP